MNIKILSVSITEPIKANITLVDNTKQNIRLEEINHIDTILIKDYIKQNIRVEDGRV